MHRLGAFLTLTVTLLATSVKVEANVTRSLYPVARPSGQGAAPVVVPVVAPVVAPVAAVARGSAPGVSLRPLARPRGLTVRAAATSAPVVQANAGYARWRTEFRQEALRQGIRAEVYDRTMAGVVPNMAVLERERSQPEFSRPIWEYLERAVSDSRIRTGQEMLRTHRALLDRIEARYGVEREVLVAVWGMESAYGALRGRDPILPSLTALAMHSRRASFYQQQLLGALTIIQAGDTDPAHLTGSWAGAMGHTQFIPTSYLAYAVDFTGDGRRDIWSDDPADSLASTAAYLARHGWTRGQPWGIEVRVPAGFNPRLANAQRDMADWRAAGIVPIGGGALRGSGEATLLFPAGSRGPAILAMQNFRVIKRYNNADAYAIAIGHLADRLRGGGPIQAAWPRDDRPLSRAEREELQSLLRRAGLYDGAIDGRVGQGTLAAVRDWQAANGLAPDGYVSFALLQRMRG